MGWTCEVGMWGEDPEVVAEKEVFEDCAAVLFLERKVERGWAGLG